MTQFPFTAWVFDGNRKVYVDDEGNRTSSPIYEKHWIKVTIVDETKRSWITEYNRKYPKTSFKGYTDGFTTDYQMVLDDIFIKYHQYKISESVKNIKDVITLKTIAGLTGYTYE